MKLQPTLLCRRALTVAVSFLALVGGRSNAQVTTCEADFRLFDHEYLVSDPVCIPENPQRILALDTASVELLLFTDKQVVGSSKWLMDEFAVILPELAGKLEGVTDVGYPANLETVVALKPDLILGFEDTMDVEAAAQIAPVVVPSSDLNNDWEKATAFWSEVLGVQDLYAEMKANYDTRVTELRAALGERGLETKVSVIGASSYGVYLWLENTAPGYILQDIGLARPASQALSGEAAIAEYGEDLWIPVSDERLDLADGDAIFVFSYAAIDPEILETETAFTEGFKKNPIFLSLEASKNNRAFFVGGHWWRSQTYLLANKVLDDLFLHLAGSSATTPVLGPSN
jgi:iron complex transport system substrate-binding protein